MDSILGFRPLARRDDLVISPAGDDLLLYDLRTHHIHQVAPVTAATWRRCDGQQDVRDLARLVTMELSQPVTSEAILQALGQLSEANLLDSPFDPGPIPARQSRRSLLRKAAVGGVAAVPAIVSVSVARAAVESCTGLECAPSVCCDGGTCIGQTCCEASFKTCGGECCYGGGDCSNSGCCEPPDHTCLSGACCPAGEECYEDGCCPAEFLCDDGNCCTGGMCYDNGHCGPT